MTPTELRHAALTLAVQTQGNPNKVTVAQEYLEFMRAEEPKAAPEAAVATTDKRKTGKA